MGESNCFSFGTWKEVGRLCGWGFLVDFFLHLVGCETEKKWQFKENKKQWDSK